MKTTVENKQTLDMNLTWWAKEYQPGLLKMLSMDWYALMDDLIGQDMYCAMKLLEQGGWKANGALVKAIAETGETRDEWANLV